MIYQETIEPNGIVHAHSPEHIAGVYGDAVAKMRAAFAEIHAQEKRINDVFGAGSYVGISTRHLRFDAPDDEIKAMERTAWRRIVDLAGTRRVMSVNKARELDDQLERGELPPLTAESIRAFIGDTKDNAAQYLAEAVKEVHDWLRPTRDRYKTNSQFDIGERVILEGMIEGAWHGFRVRYGGYAEPRMRALDNVFAMLAGKPGIQTHNGPLADAIAAAGIDGTGETEFFAFRACRNGNLHLRFKRMDLVGRLNAIAGGRNLYAP